MFAIVHYRTAVTRRTFTRLTFTTQLQAWFVYAYRLIAALISAVPLSNVSRNEKSAQRDANTAPVCALAVVRRSQKISPCRRPLPGGGGRTAKI